MRTEATASLAAARADVWSFLAEPYHLSDWWPGIAGVEPDRRGFAPGARWQVRGTRWTNPITGRRPMQQLVVVDAIEPFERWQFLLVADRLTVEVRLRATAPARTEVTVAVVGPFLVGGRRPLARKAVERLRALVQTGET